MWRQRILNAKFGNIFTWHSHRARSHNFAAERAAKPIQLEKAIGEPRP